MNLELIANKRKPSGLTVNLKNKALAFRWIAANEIRYNRRKAEGYRPGTKEEIDCPYAVFENGYFKYGDLICCVMSKEKHDEYKAINEYRAQSPIQQLKAKDKSKGFKGEVSSKRGRITDDKD